MLTLHIEQVLTQIIAFLLMFWILQRFAWKPLMGVMEERRKKIIEELDAIHAEKEGLKNLEVQYNEKLKKIDEEARIKINEGIERGNNLAAQIKDEAHQEANYLLNRAREEIELEIAKGKDQLKKEVISMAITMTEKILHEQLDDKKQKELVAEFVQKAKLE
jgi:F-type H+-transporting ATPase subunit b